MRAIKHTALHVFVHLALFTALAMLIPVVSAWISDVDANKNPITEPDANTTNNTAHNNTATNDHTNNASSANIILASTLLIIVCIILVYRMKESLEGVFKSIGAMVFLPGALAVIFGVLSADAMINAMSNIALLSFLQPIADFYIHHSVPNVLSVAAVYMMIGGVLYWMGNLVANTKQKISFQ